jgi:DNA-directed RNA polymerase III subunit RPC8
MFTVVTLMDIIRIPAHNLRVPTLKALQNEIDLKYPNRVLMGVGLVISRYGNILKITNGTCVPGDGGSHHECLFRLVIFRPFVEEVCVGTIVKSTREGVQVSLGFFQNIFIPAYWMLRPSEYDEKLGLWVWTPDYGDGDEDDEEKDEEKDNENDNENDNGEETENGGTNGNTAVKEEEVVKEEEAVKEEEDSPTTDKIKTEDNGNSSEVEEEKDAGDRWEMEIGAEIRFKVKSIQFTQVTNTAKGVQATTTTTDHSHSIPTADQEEPDKDKPRKLRTRSTSMDLSDSENIPGAMQIIASICEDGLGITSWWKSAEDDEDEEDEEDNEDDEGEEEEEQ